jgi:hypothetical protein
MVEAGEAESNSQEGRRNVSAQSVELRLPM